MAPGSAAAGRPSASGRHRRRGCGTGSFLVLLGKAAALPRLIGIDPDDDILARAKAKLTSVGVSVDLRRGYLRDASMLSNMNVNKIVSSLVFHQVPMTEKRAGLRAIFSTLASNGELHVADYGLQRDAPDAQLLQARAAGRRL